MKNYAVVTGKSDEQSIEFRETAVKGSLPVERDIPAHDEKTQVAGVSGYDVQKDKVVVKYKVEDKPIRDPRFTLDEFADMVAEKVAARLK